MPLAARRTNLPADRKFDLLIDRSDQDPDLLVLTLVGSVERGLGPKQSQMPEPNHGGKQQLSLPLPRRSVAKDRVQLLGSEHIGHGFCEVDLETIQDSVDHQSALGRARKMPHCSYAAALCPARDGAKAAHRVAGMLASMGWQVEPVSCLALVVVAETR